MFELRQGDQAPMIDGVEVTASAADLNATTNLAAGMAAVEAFAAMALKYGSYTVTADDDTANTKTIVTGLTAVAGQVVQIIRAGKVATVDAAVSHAAGNITIANGSTFVLTAADVVNWIAFGTL